MNLQKEVYFCTEVKVTLSIINPRGLFSKKWCGRVSPAAQGAQSDNLQTNQVQS